jgi:biotin operon repressor
VTQDAERPGGFIVLHRRIESWPLWQAMNAEHRHIWTTLLLAANWKNSEVWTRKGRLVIQRGQALIAQRTLAERAGASRQNVRTAIEMLTSEGAIQVTQVPVHGAKTASLITIVNYEKYQAVEERDDFDATASQPKSNPIRTRGTSSRSDRFRRSEVHPSVDRGEGRVIKLNPDDVLSDWDHQQQRHVPRGITAHGRERLRRGRA